MVVVVVVVEEEETEGALVSVEFDMVQNAVFYSRGRLEPAYFSKQSLSSPLSGN